MEQMTSPVTISVHAKWSAEPERLYKTVVNK